ncbi:AN1-type zinc finger domain-containing protein [Nitrososphaera sp.]|uniref:AN1-type zinc finger domain-containing protein n=1 Tax=Nitrososphaera sp. TaxID=1971748 RepID=UPI0025FD2E13|nr:AN1-type zinc finger domain-containing protein [Nitrososphaera sp.]
MECGICGAREEMPFKCRYCKGLFCAQHRLPPNHSCVFLEQFLRQPEKDREFLAYIEGQRGSAGERAASAFKNTVLLRFSWTELGHLAVGTALVAAVGMTFFRVGLQPEFLAIFVTAFLLHEVAHKFLAQFYRAWAEFRLILFGAVITAISALPFLPFKFIAPGAVFISGSISQRRNGRISLVGPLTNIALGSGFMLAYLATGVELMADGAWFNGWVGVFNMIPFMGLDGSKIFSWNKLVWALAFAAAIGLYAAGSIASGSGFFSFLR